MQPMDHAAALTLSPVSALGRRHTSSHSELQSFLFVQHILYFLKHLPVYLRVNMVKKKSRPRASVARAEPVGICPVCERPNYFPSDHHMVPKSRGGRTTETICADCHKAVHAHFTNKELERQYNTASALLAHPEFAKTVRFLQNQDPRRRMRTKKRRR